MDLAKQFALIHAKGRALISIEPIVAGKDTCMYLANYDKGWIMIAGDKRVQPILGKDRDNCLYYHDIQSSPYLSTWCGMLIDDILGVKSSNSFIQNEHTCFWNKIEVSPKNKQIKTKSLDEPIWALFYDYTTLEDYVDDITVSHLLRTSWGQKSPWNNKCPDGFDDDNNQVKCPTGCSAVAMAQVLYYMHNKIGTPSGLYHSIYCSGFVNGPNNYCINFTRGDYVANSARWNEMALSSSGTSTEYVGDLMLDIGNRIGMTYSVSGSGAYPSNVGFNYYSLRCDESSYSTSTIVTNLLNEKPVIIVGYRTHTPSFWPFQGQYSNGHTWVIDGLRTDTYSYINHCHLEYTTEIADAYILYVDNEIDTEFPDYYDGMEVEEPYEKRYDLFYMNWGWNYIDPAAYSVSADYSLNASHYDYIYNRTVYYNFRPL